MFILFFLAILVVLCWFGIGMTPGQKRKRELKAERIQERMPFWESCASRGLDILQADENEKRIIGKKIFRQQLIRSIPAMLSWTAFLMFPALATEKLLVFFGCIAVIILLCIMTMRFYLLHPFALLEGDFDLYGGICQQKREYEHDNMPDERQVKMYSVWLDVDAIRLKALRTSYYYYIVQFYNGKEFLFLRTDDIAAESRIGGNSNN
jgi:hypothetical protein